MSRADVAKLPVSAQGAPDAPDDLSAQVARAERRRARAVRRLILLGAGLIAAGVALSAATARSASPTPPLALALMAAGFLAAAPCAALAALWLGPSWELRQRHYRQLHTRGSAEFRRGS